MRAAPPVDVQLGSGRRERLLVAALVLIASWALLHGAVAHAGRAWPWPIEWALAAVLAAVAGWRTHPLVGHLRWDGQAWGWRPSPAADGSSLETVRAMIDLDGWMLLKADAAWCGLSRAEAGAAWHGLRVALFASRPAEEHR